MSVYRIRVRCSKSHQTVQAFLMLFSKRLPPAFSSTVVFFAATLTPQSALAQEPVERCNPIARVTQGNGHNFEQGEIICSGTTLEGANNAQILCFINNTIFTLDERVEVISEQSCTTGEAATYTRQCEAESTAQCFIPKGPDNDFVITEPDIAVAPARPSLSWEAVESAEFYTVRLIGSDITWEHSVEGPQLDYPVEEPSLQPGAYRIVISANSSDEIIGVSSRVINVQLLIGHI
ncbi:MAG: hypothetical protein AAGF01_28750 [Cyanobacteria bacterium P01_G01_bin.38]